MTKQALLIPERTHGYCLVCRGENRPAELSIIELPVMGGEVDMGSEKGLSLCVACNQQKKSVFPHYGEPVCPSCTMVRSQIKNRPELVLEQFRKLAPEYMPGMKDQTESLRHLVDELHPILNPNEGETMIDAARRRMTDLQAVFDNNMDLVIENRALKEAAGGNGENSLLAELREILGAGDGDIVQAARNVVARLVTVQDAQTIAVEKGRLASEDRDNAVAELREIKATIKAGDDEDLVEVAERRMKLLAKLDKMVAEVGAERDHLSDEVGVLRGRLQAAVAQPVPAVFEARKCSCSEGRDKMLLDLVLGAMGDQVISLDAGTIRALRG